MGDEWVVGGAQSGLGRTQNAFGSLTLAPRLVIWKFETSTQGSSFACLNQD